MVTNKCVSVAVIGAGIAGAAATHALQQAGCAVHLFDKSRGPGGRMATRRSEWVDSHGHTTTTHFDHGAVGFSANSPAFGAFVEDALQAGWLALWKPHLAAGSAPLEDGGGLYVPVPQMPALCHHLVQGASASWSFAVDALIKSPVGLQVQSAGVGHDGQFDAVVIALPPAQAAPLLSSHRPDWARYAYMTPMQPCWTLMGVADAAQPALDWDLVRPQTGPLAWVFRNDARPGRACVPGQAHWVAHAKAGWSIEHLDQPTAWVQEQMQSALSQCLGQDVHWRFSAVHRWRYALPQVPKGATASPDACWWDPALGLGVCADFLGGCGVEGAWLSAQALSHALLQDAPATFSASATLAPFSAAPHPLQRRVV